MTELQNFRNDGYGWVCILCTANTDSDQSTDSPLPRIYREGEAENKVATLANKGLARWTDKTRRFLLCPQCGVTEDTFIS